MPLPPDALDRLQAIFTDGIPFNQFLGLTVREIERGRVVMDVPFRRPDYVGDVQKDIVHGGVLSTLIDVTGGAVAYTMLEPELGERSVNTIDMRVDFVRMGRGNSFTATGTVIRKGSRVCVARVEVTSDSGLLVAHGTAAYTIFSERTARSESTAAREFDLG